MNWQCWNCALIFFDIISYYMRRHCWYFNHLKLYLNCILFPFDEIEFLFLFFYEMNLTYCIWIAVCSGYCVDKHSLPTYCFLIDQSSCNFRSKYAKPVITNNCIHWNTIVLISYGTRKLLTNLLGGSYCQISNMKYHIFAWLALVLYYLLLFIDIWCDYCFVHLSHYNLILYVIYCKCYYLVSFYVWDMNIWW
jgi:hypothetical protein